MRILKVRFNYLFKLLYGLPHEGSCDSPHNDHYRAIDLYKFFCCLPTKVSSLLNTVGTSYLLK
jgi:hypothetical protein